MNSDTGKIVEWLRNNSVGLPSLDLAPDFLQLSPLIQTINSAHVIGLGEATHGSKEFSQMKFLLIRFLVQNLRFNTIIIEIPEVPAQQINKYIHSNSGNIRKILEDAGYWIINTFEVVEMIEWLKDYNQKHLDAPVSLHGCDIPSHDPRRKQILTIRDEAMSENILSILNEEKNRKAIIWAHNSHTSYLDISSFKTTGSFLKDKLKEKYINFCMYFYKGEFLAVNEKNRQIESFFLESDDNSYASYFKNFELLSYIIDLRKMKNNSLFDSWYSGEHSIIEVGAVFNPDIPEEYTHTIDLPNKFDCSIFIKNVSAVSLNQWSYR